MKLGALFHFIDMRSPSFFLLDFARRISFVGWQPEWMPWAKAIIRKYLRWWRKWVLCFNLAARSIAAGHQAEQKKNTKRKLLAGNGCAMCVQTIRTEREKTLQIADPICTATMRCSSLIWTQFARACLCDDVHHALILMISCLWAVWLCGVCLYVDRI